MSFMKHWHIWMLLVFVVASLLAIGLRDYPYGRDGVKIAYVARDSPAYGVFKQGMIITSLNGATVADASAWQTLSSATGPVKLTVDGRVYEFAVNKTLGIDAVDMERTNIELGLDLQGGTRIVLKPKTNATPETIQQIISILQTRANLYGLKEINFYPVSGIGESFVQIEAAGVGSDVVDDLLSRQGTFYALINKTAPVKEGEASLRIGDSYYNMTLLDNGTISVGGNAVQPGGKFTLQDVEFLYVGRTNRTAEFLAKVFDNDDIELVYTDPQKSGIQPQGKVFFFHFAVLVSKQGAERFAALTKGMGSYLDMASGEEYLDGKLFLYLDDEQISDLNIGAGLRGQVINTPSIQGSRETRDAAMKEMLSMQTVLRSGALPVSLETVSVDVISPRLGSSFFESTAYAALLAAAIVVALIVIRYRSLNVAIPMIFISFSEVLIIMGVAAGNDSRIWMSALAVNALIVGLAYWKKEVVDMSGVMGALLVPLVGLISWTIDLAAIAGVVAIIGTGVNHQIIIADETMMRTDEEKKKKTYFFRDHIKRAFFIIFGAAATTVAAMTPLIILGIGMIRGFAITALVGTLIGVLVTRPAYAGIIERVMSKKERL